ncbi:NAD(P)-dependent oxidoreductase [Sphingobacterium sp. DR205]|uniref:NAD(P)-dependent oxidoreductase n=1 Tax=Sphingobacterium sp. DR205 TaxID=2713573 RepID=UPI0013E4D7FF|nr:NAD(P)-dependent oxidoreductase [Sphingobacterium sp. DR205]QIH36312.1 phosphoglycerate dehydrogenase [Sphingobacterium sp. DR205]
MKANILIVDDIHEIMLEKFEQAGIPYDYQPDIDRQEAEKIIANYSGMVIRSKFQVDKAFFDLAPNLRFIARAGAGMDNIDDEIATQRQITLIPANEGNRDAVGEHMIGMLLSLMNNLNRSDQQVRAGQWLREANRGYELKGRTVGLVGYGHNGMAMAKKLSGFEVNVLAYDKYRTEYTDQYAEEATMEDIYSQADVISFHIPLTAETKGMIDSVYLSKFKKPIFFLLGARGGIVQVPAVLAGLDSGNILGAAFDVLPVEKFPKLAEQTWYQELIRRENVILSPHVAGWTFESYYKLSAVAADKIIAFLKLQETH